MMEYAEGPKSRIVKLVTDMGAEGITVKDLAAKMQIPLGSLKKYATKLCDSGALCFVSLRRGHGMLCAPESLQAHTELAQKKLQAVDETRRKKRVRNNMSYRERKQERQKQTVKFHPRNMTQIKSKTWAPVQVLAPTSVFDLGRFV
jgi:hypothetical protein